MSVTLPIAPVNTVGRNCGTCVACCVYFKIADLGKPALTPCSKLAAGCTDCGTAPADNNCTIYEDRPEVCKGYSCMWLYGYGEDEDRPDKSGMILDNATPVANVLRGLPMQEGADNTERGNLAINRISRDRNQPVMVCGWPETRIIRVVGRGAE